MPLRMHEYQLQQHKVRMNALPQHKSSEKMDSDHDNVSNLICDEDDFAKRTSLLCRSFYYSV